MNEQGVLELVRDIALALPETSERLSHGAPTFFIRNKKTFVMFMKDHHGDGRVGIWASAPAGVQAELVEQDGERFYVPPYVGHRGWIGLRLDIDLDREELLGVITDAYRNVAPKTLVRLLDEENPT